jgi:DnaK suppressor protein
MPAGSTILNTNHERVEKLRTVLVSQRDHAWARVREFRHDQEGDAIPPPADEMDLARSTADLETHASLIEQAEDRLAQIDDALARLNEGRYGICAKCVEEIAVERLNTLPFVLYCVDCQRELNRARRRGEGSLSRSFGRRWETPLEMDESLERTDAMSQPEEETTIREGRPFGREEGTPDHGRMPRTGRGLVRRGRPKRSA